MLVALDIAEFNGSEDINIPDNTQQMVMTIGRRIDLRRWKSMNKYILFCALDKVTLLLTFNVKIINSVYARFGGEEKEMIKEGCWNEQQRS